MAVTKSRFGTEFSANAITFTRGTSAQITAVGVYHDTDPDADPNVAAFTTVTLVEPGDPLGETGKIDVLSLIGPKAGADLNLAGPTNPGDPPIEYWRWVLVQTAQEDIIRGPIDKVTIT